MRITEIVPLLEFGRHGFPGYNRGLFAQRYYVAFANEITTIEDPHVKEFVVDFFVNAMLRDSTKFKESVFRDACQKEYDGIKNIPQLQQRHFYYLAEMVKKIDDEHAREYMANWMAGWLRHTNMGFQKRRWMQFCGIEQK